MSKRCVECPYSNAMPGAQTRGFPNHSQPCHMTPQRPCVGHGERLALGVVGDEHTDEIRLSVGKQEQTEDHWMMKELRERWRESGLYHRPEIVRVELTRVGAPSEPPCSSVPTSSALARSP